MIRRLLVVAALSLGFIVASATAANAANVLCAYNTSPLNVGICVTM